MAKRRWTVVLVPHTSEPSRIIEVSYGVLKSLAVAVGVVAILALLLGYGAVSRTADLQRTARLQGKRAAGAAAGEINGRLATLTDTLSRIAQRDAHIRVLANLEPIDPQVQAAGVGGPAEPAPPGAAETPAIRQSHEIRVDLNALIRRANLLALSFAKPPTAWPPTPPGSPPRRRSCRRRAGSPAPSPPCAPIRSCTSRGRTRASTSRPRWGARSKPPLPGW